MPATSAPATRQPPAFLWLYALAWAGGAVAYVPLLTILLPVRVAELADGQQVHWLAYITFFGALAASVGGIVFGWASDRTGSRRPWIACGLAGTVLLGLAMSIADSMGLLLLLIVLWQLALNMMLLPLAAWAADHVPRGQLGYLGGLLAFSPALGSAAGALVTIRGLADWEGRLALVAMLVVVCVLPALLFARPSTTASDAELNATPVEAHTAPDPRLAATMWAARFLIQISEAALFAFLYYWFLSVDPSYDAAWTARLFGLVLCVAVPLAMIVGSWSDRAGRPMLPLVICAATAAVALAGMALAREPLQAVACYVLFGLVTTTFLSLHSAQTFRVLKRSGSRGRDLGIFNLTNTGPSLIMPWLTIALVPSFGFAGLFALLAALALAAALSLLSVAWRLRRA